MTSYISDPKIRKNNDFYDIDYSMIKKIIAKNEKDKSKGASVTKKRYKEKKQAFSNNQTNFRHEFNKEILENDPLTNGFKIQYPHGIILSQASNSSYFRGENQIYKSSIPSLLRELHSISSIKEKELYRLVSDMKVAEFSFLLDKFEHVKKWIYSDVLYDVLAQHYGLETGWLDITSDFKTALFFATCYNHEGKWKPLTKKQTEEKESTKYGVIYHIPSKIAVTKMGASINKEYSSNGLGSKRPLAQRYNTILPIGFQPFMRCHMQYGYGIYMRKPYSLQSDNQFEKLRFRHSEKLSREIYDLMNGGELIYPQEGISDISFIIKTIKDSDKFSYKAFEYALKRNHYYSISERDLCLQDLGNIKIDNKFIKIENKHPWHLSSLRRRKIDKRYMNFSLKKNYKIKVVTRNVVPNGSPMYAPWMLAEDESYKGVFDFEPRPIECYSLWTRHLIYLLNAIESAKLTDYL